MSTDTARMHIGIHATTLAAPVFKFFIAHKDFPKTWNIL
tara:strand:+ start:163 stop:279 length:117 start_codon:yes stop_codon:yes gene_type:complete